MKVYEHIIDVWSDTTKIVFVGDVHAGNGATDDALVEQTAQRIRNDDNAYWIDLGDKCDFINMRDKRFDPATLPKWMGVEDLVDLPESQIERYVHHFHGLGAKCLANLEGNHEQSIRKRYERNVYREIALKLGIPTERCLGMWGFLRLRFRDTRKKTKSGGAKDVWTVTMFLHHGSGGGKLAGGKAINLERLPMSFNADVYAVAHTHTKLAMYKRRIGVMTRKNKIEDREMIMLNTGAFMRSYQDNSKEWHGDNYAEQALMYPQGVGPIELWFNPSNTDGKRITVVQ